MHELSFKYTNEPRNIPVIVTVMGNDGSQRAFFGLENSVSKKLHFLDSIDETEKSMSISCLKQVPSFKF